MEEVDELEVDRHDGARFSLEDRQFLLNHARSVSVLRFVLEEPRWIRTGMFAPNNAAE